MSIKNKSMFAILGILNIAPSTGYDIKKYCDTVLSGFWNENYGHIYPTLKTMMTEGMIDLIHADEEKNDHRILYQITNKGKHELDSWLVEETIQQPVRSEFMLKFIFSSNQPKAQIRKMLEDYKSLYIARMDRYHGMLEKLQEGDNHITSDRSRFLHAVLRRGVLSDQAVIDWCEETIQELM